jgi:hypothetical protein
MTHLLARAVRAACALLPASALALSVLACSGTADSDLDAPGGGAGDENVGEGGEALTSRTFSNATVLYQGDWSFLTRCDKWSKGRVRFACDEAPSRTFVDDEAWVAMPSTLYSRRHCKKEVELCRGTRCITAKVVERSVTSGKWEGSSAVMEALGINHGAPSCTRSWGTATGVTIKGL